MNQDSSGKFVAGNKASPGRPRKSVEERYLKKLSASVTLADWKDICKKAVTDAKRGDPRARQWISEYLLGKPLQRNELTGKDGDVIVIKLVDDDNGD
jgi:hypothetical protein